MKQISLAICCCFCLGTQGKANSKYFDIGTTLNKIDTTININDNKNSWLKNSDRIQVKKKSYNIKTSLNVKSKKHQYSFQLEKMDHRRKKKLSSDILRNGARLATMSLKKTNISIKWAKFKYRFNLNENISIGADLNAIESKVYSGSRNKKDITHKKRIFIPSIAIDAQKSLDEHLEILAKISSSIKKNSSKYLYKYAGFSYKLPFRKATRVHFGYQSKTLNIITKEINEALHYNGLYTGVAIKF